MWLSVCVSIRVRACASHERQEIKTLCQDSTLLTQWLRRLRANSRGGQGILSQRRDSFNYDSTGIRTGESARGTRQKKAYILYQQRPVKSFGFLLKMRPRISIRGPARRSVGPSVRRSVGNAFFFNSENEELSWKKVERTHLFISRPNFFKMPLKGISLIKSSYWQINRYK